MNENLDDNNNSNEEKDPEEIYLEFLI